MYPTVLTKPKRLVRLRREKKTLYDGHGIGGEGATIVEMRVESSASTSLQPLNNSINTMSSSSVSPFQSAMKTSRTVVTLLNQSVSVDIEIQRSWETKISFTFLERPYSFNITRWKSRGLRTMLKLFHLAIQRRPADSFGSIIRETVEDDEADDEQNSGLEENSDDDIVSDESEIKLITTKAQNFNIIIQMCRDIMMCLDMILTKHQRAVVDYALWFREKHYSQILNRQKENGGSILDNGPNYFEIITLLTCHMIVHIDFFNPTINFELVIFNYPVRENSYSDVLRKKSKN